MTDDTDNPARETADSARSLPLIDTFAALQAELAAKEQRIERLESELAQGYLDPGGGQPDDAAAGDDRAETRSHEDWEPATDPLSETGAVDASGAPESEGVTPNSGESVVASGERPETNAREAAESSGLQPVRTVSSSEPTDGDSRRTDAGADDTPGEDFGVTMESTTDLTGGSLGSSTDETFVAAARETNDDDTDESPRPDPTADRGERLSGLVRRGERQNEKAVVDAFVRGISALDDVTQEMLAHYREAGDAAPVDAHVAAGGSGERQYAYARNRTLRKAGVIEHDGAGRYRYALPDLVEEAFDGNAEGQTVADAVDDIEAATGIAE